jgi:beta-glucosidase
MSYLYGVSIGEEARYRNKDVLLGPGVNIYRTPLNGRNFEYMGEDPCLASKMVVPYIKGVQEQGVATCVKHYALNNQEVDRHWVNVNLSDRALYEIYLPAFRAAMQEGGSWSIMGAYNLYKGQYACHNSILLQDILRKEWGSDAAVISDWGGAMNTEQAITNGLDLEFGTWTDGLSDGASSAYDIYHLALPYLRKIQSGEVGTKELDEKVRNVLRLIFRTSMNPNKPFGAMCSEAHSAAARQIAGEGMVLLRNENHTLPIELTQHPTILVVGENAIKMMTVGGGSSSLKAKYEISPLQGIQERAEGLAEVKYVRGYVGDIGGEYNGVTTGQSLQDDRTPEQLTAEAVEAAKSADYVVFVGGMNKAHNQDCEDGDRLHYELPYAQDQLISALAAVNDKVIFVSISGNAHGMPWNQEVEAILQAWYSGSETGHAVADVLFGDVNPSGKLPYTIQPTLADYPAHQYGEEAYPGVDKQVYYKEDIFVGYRYADLYGTRRPIKYVSQGKQYTINPPKHQALFPFGFGLSYTTFEYSKATLDGNQITVSITNTGNRAGQEVVQLYITDSKASVVRPKKELKGFSKVALLPGETKQVTFTITPDMLSYFDADAHHWIAEEGLFVIHIASSSTDIHASLPYNYKK